MRINTLMFIVIDFTHRGDMDHMKKQVKYLICFYE